MPRHRIARRPRDHSLTAERPDRLTLLAFVGMTLCGGANAVAIRLGNPELPPFWGAALRFLLAAGLLLLAMAARRVAMPRGRALTGVVIYGLLSFGVGYMFAYWALVEATAGTAQLVLATVPLLTLILAVVQGVERFRLRGLIGSLVAAAGIAVLFLDRLGPTSPLALLALLGAAASFAQAGIVVKRFPKSHPLAANGLGMLVGGALLLALALLTGERTAIPSQPVTWISLAYLIVVGSIGLFMLFLFVIHRWTATGTSYSLLIMPVVTVALGALILSEPVSVAFALGGLLVLAGVYVGALAPDAGHPLIIRSLSRLRRPPVA
jgi:drug/metabolite transporter (DMT)-like permease